MIKNLKIGPIVYEVSEEKDLHTFTNEWQKKFLTGHIRNHPCSIKVEAEMSIQTKTVAVMHEAIHGIMEQAGIEESEQWVLALGYGLVSLIQDNPEFVRQIWETARQAERSESEQLKHQLFGDFNGTSGTPHLIHKNGDGNN